MTTRNAVLLEFKNQSIMPHFVEGFRDIKKKELISSGITWTKTRLTFGNKIIGIKIRIKIIKDKFFKDFTTN